MVENLVSGKKYRILTNAASDIWDRISFWTRASDVYYNDNTSAEANKPINVLKRSTRYSVNDVAYAPNAPSWVMLVCSTAGTTSSSLPSTYGSSSVPGAVITDGTAKFTVYDVRPNQNLNTSAYQMPTMSIVNHLNYLLTAPNNQHFYFDYKNNQYGFNTSANRDGTFIPFSSGNKPGYIASVYYTKYIGGGNVAITDTSTNQSVYVGKKSSDNDHDTEGSIELGDFYGYYSFSNNRRIVRNRYAGSYVGYFRDLSPGNASVLQTYNNIGPNTDLWNIDDQDTRDLSIVFWKIS